MRQIIFKNEIKELISKMTLKEKVGQLNQRLYGWQLYEKTENGYELTDIFKNEVKRWGGIGAIYGIFRADPWSQVNFENGIPKEDCKTIINMIQEYITENTRLKIPVLFTEECPHGHQALDGEMFPCNIGIGSTWNTNLVKAMASSISDELSKKGANLALVSTLDVLRDPRWGRSEECFSEDPFLCSKYTESIVEGYQKNNFENGVGVVLKHLCAQGGAVGGHNSGAANIGERELREIFLPPVEAGAKSGAIGVMAAYNEIDGIPCHANRKLLTDTLREEYGFDGIVMADGCALDRLLIMTRNEEKACKLAIDAGVDLSLWDEIYPHLDSAVEKGIVDESDIDLAVSRILEVKFKLGLFENRGSSKSEVSSEAEYNTISKVALNDEINLKEERNSTSDLNTQVARESIILLKNENILPLNMKKKKIAVIGPNANNVYNQLGDYTSPQRPGDVITVLDGIKSIVNEEIEINYAKGCGIINKDKSGFEEAINLAKKSDYAVVIIGGSSSRESEEVRFENNGAAIVEEGKLDVNCGENLDKASLDLDGVQAELVKEIKNTGTKVIVVLIQGRPHSIENIKDYTDAILCAWYPGKMGGKAVAETIFGLNNPSGKLAVSIPVSSMQLPCYYNGKDSGAKVDYLDMKGVAAYPFGFGLSYSKFKYSNLRFDCESISIEELKEGKEITVTVDIENISDIDGLEVVQLYTIDMESTVTRRFKELKGFNKVFIKSKDKIAVDIKISKKELSIWDSSLQSSVEEGEVKILVGDGSEQCLEKTLIISG